MQISKTKQAAGQYENAMLEHLWANNGLVMPKGFLDGAHADFYFHLLGDAETRPCIVYADTEIATTPGLFVAENASLPNREIARLGLHIGSDGTGKPLATAALGKSEVLALLFKLLDWAAVLTGAGAFHEHLKTSSETAKIHKVLGAAEDLRRTLAAHAVVGATNPRKS